MNKKFIYKRIEMDVSKIWDDICNEHEFFEVNKYKLDDYVTVEVIFKLDKLGSYRRGLHFNLSELNKDLRILSISDRLIYLDEINEMFLIQTFSFILINKDIESRQYIVCLKFNHSNKKGLIEECNEIADNYLQYIVRKPKDEVERAIRVLLSYEEATKEGIVRLLYYYSKLTFYFFKYETFYDENIFKEIINKKADFLGYAYDSDGYKSFEELKDNVNYRDENEMIEELLKFINNVNLTEVDRYNVMKYYLSKIEENL